MTVCCFRHTHVGVGNSWFHTNVSSAELRKTIDYKKNIERQFISSSIVGVLLCCRNSPGDIIFCFLFCSSHSPADESASSQIRFCIALRRPNSKMTSQKTCCGWMSLRTATISIGVLDIVIHILISIIGIGAFDKQYFAGIVSAVSAALLIVGAVKRNHQWMWLWIIMSGLSLVIAPLMLIYIAYIAFHLEFNTPSSMDIRMKSEASERIGLMTEISVPIFGFCACRVYVVWRYMKELRAEIRRQQAPNGSLIIE